METRGEGLRFYKMVCLRISTVPARLPLSTNHFPTTAGIPRRGHFMKVGLEETLTISIEKISIGQQREDKCSLQHSFKRSVEQYNLYSRSRPKIYLAKYAKVINEWSSPSLQVKASYIKTWAADSTLTAPCYLICNARTIPCIPKNLPPHPLPHLQQGQTGHKS